jgi:hypothetical protein
MDGQALLGRSSEGAVAAVERGLVAELAERGSALLFSQARFKEAKLALDQSPVFLRKLRLLKLKSGVNVSHAF